MGDLSTHFDRKEFECRCKCGFDTVDSELLILCEVAREIEDGPLIVNSGCRCESHNKSIGGVENSKHVQARAADLKSKNPVYLFDELCKKYPNQYGFGIYDDWVHVDSRKEASRWDSRT